MKTVIVENLYKKFSKGLGDSVRSGIKAIYSRNDNVKTNLTLNKGEFWALENVSFELDQGDSLGILGVNGSGKTTLLRILNGTYKPDKGMVSIKQPVGSLIAAGAGFSPTLTGRENIYLSASLLGLTPREIHRRFESIVEFSELENFLEMPLSHYSSGMSVRLAFAVATSVRPEVLLIDEVLAVGDIGFQRKCINRIQDLRTNGTTLIIVSHSTETTWELCNKAMLLNNGKTAGIQSTKFVISEYVNKTIKNNRQSDNKDLENKYLKNIQLNSIALLNNIKTNDSIYFGEALTLMIDFSNNTELNNVYIRLNISSDLYSPIATVDGSLTRKGIMNLKTGDHKLKLQLASTRLKPGSYWIDLSFSDSNGGPHLEIFKNALTFKILASDTNFLYDFGIKALVDLPIESIDLDCQ